MQNYSTGKYTRSRERVIAGVCAMIARETGIDVNLVRLVTVIAAVLTSGIVPVIYIAAWVVLPMDGEQHTVLDDLIGKGKGKVNEYQASRQNTPTAQPGPAPQTPAADATSGETFDPYKED